ncbi:uncharacterized protein VTP21DRAFT_11442 [Calcarisporiella thermophila]|uniref:uncharacterized protein n=1 Tax=Calcarisporiella thermophila TaxID=911321 RepID=UPI0037446749
MPGGLGGMGLIYLFRGEMVGDCSENVFGKDRQESAVAHVKPVNPVNPAIDLSLPPPFLLITSARVKLAKFSGHKWYWTLHVANQPQQPNL